MIKKQISQYGIVALLALLCACSSGRTTIQAYNGKSKANTISTAKDNSSAAVRFLGVGWNIGNHLDSHNNGMAGETAWGNPAATQAAFDAVKRAGFTSVRIPVTWLGKIGSAPDYKVDKAWLDRVAEIVEYARKAGLNAIVNIHHDGSDSQHWVNIAAAAKSDSVNTQVKRQLAAVWTQIANKFKNYGDFLMFEALNEIHDGGWGWGENRKDGGKQYKVLNEWMQVFVDAVRATGGNNKKRWLGICGYCANADLTMEHLVIPRDPAKNRLMISVHYYGPTEYTLSCKFSEWGHTAATNKKASDDMDECNVTKVFGELKTAFIDKGYPVYIGETGNSYRGNSHDEAFRKYFLEYIAKAARDNGLAMIIWDNGLTAPGAESHGYINHATGEYINNSKEILKAFTGGYNNNDPNYTLEKVYEKAPKSDKNI